MLKEEKYGFVYIWYDCAKSKKHEDQHLKRYYIGCHWGIEDDGYICSSNWMRQAKLRRPQDFKRKILSRIYTNRKDLIEEEFKWLVLIKKEELGKRYYNLHNHLAGQSDEIIEKIRQARLGKPRSIITIEKLRQANKGKKASENAKRNMSEAHKGKILSNETKEKLKGRIPWNKNKSLSEEYRRKLSEAHKGQIAWNKGKINIYSEEYRKKLSEARKNYWEKKKLLK